MRESMSMLLIMISGIVFIWVSMKFYYAKKEQEEARKSMVLNAHGEMVNIQNPDEDPFEYDSLMVGDGKVESRCGEVGRSVL